MTRGPRNSDHPHLREGEVLLGHVNGVFGLRGEVRLYLLNPDSPLLEQGADVTLLSPDGVRKSVRIEARGGAGRRILGLISGVRDPEAARALMGWSIVVPRVQLPPAEPGAYYVHDLLGLPVSTPESGPLGTLTDVHAAGEVDVWVVESDDGQWFVPALQRLIVEVKPGEGVVLHEDARAYRAV